jgi:hypothetical protein
MNFSIFMAVVTCTKAALIPQRYRYEEPVPTRGPIVDETTRALFWCGNSFDYDYYGVTTEVYIDENSSVTTPETDLFTSTEIIQQDNTAIGTTVPSKYSGLEQNLCKYLNEIIVTEENTPDGNDKKYIRQKNMFEKAFDVICYPIEKVGSLFRKLFGY